MGGTQGMSEGFPGDGTGGGEGSNELFSFFVKAGKR
jgi:hypothetical protein